MFEVLRKIYLNSILYDKKISRTFEDNLEYKPSAYLLSSITKIKNKKFNINDYTFDEFWTSKKINQKQFKRINNFFWIFSLDLKSSHSAVQSIISNWIKINEKFNDKSWDFDTTSKRIISWLSNSKLTYSDCSNDYKASFNYMIQKQALHLINHIENSKTYNDKLIGVTAIILVGLSFKNETPSIGLLTVNALTAADEVLVPIQCEYLALEGLGQLLSNVEKVKTHLNERLHISMIALVMFDGRTKLSTQVVQEVRGHFGDKVCNQIIPRSVRLSEGVATSHQRNRFLIVHSHAGEGVTHLPA